MAIVGDPGALRELFALPVDAFQWGHRFNVLGFVVGADSLIVSDGAEWKRRRSAIRSGFSRRRLDGWVDTLVRLVDERIDSIVDRSAATGRHNRFVVDMYDEARELVQKMAIRTLFGAELAERSSEIARSSGVHSTTWSHRRCVSCHIRFRSGDAVGSVPTSPRCGRSSRSVWSRFDLRGRATAAMYSP